MRSLLLLLTALLTACETTYREGATITSASGQRLCAKHRTPLVPLTVYQAPTHGGQVWLVHDANHWYYNIVGQYYPNHIPQHVALSRTDFFSERTAVYYCPLCEREFWNALRIPDESAAIKYAKDALPNYGGGGVRTKGPYQVSLNKGVWTVKCFLVDGRKASMKISKNDGSITSTDFYR